MGTPPQRSLITEAPGSGGKPPEIAGFQGNQTRQKVLVSVVGAEGLEPPTPSL